MLSFKPRNADASRKSIIAAVPTDVVQHRRRRALASSSELAALLKRAPRQQVSQS